MSAKNRIRELRKAAGLTGGELAEMLHITAQYLYELERGEKRLNEDLIERLCSIFGVSSDYLLGFSDAIAGRPASALGQRYPSHIIPERLARMMELRGLNVGQLALRAGVAEAEAQAALDGKLVNPDLGFVQAVARALRIPLDYLVSEEVLTPLDVLDNLSPDMVDWLLRQDAIPFLEITRQAQERGLSPETLQKMLDFFTTLQGKK